MIEGEVKWVNINAVPQNQRAAGGKFILYSLKMMFIFSLLEKFKSMRSANNYIYLFIFSFHRSGQRSSLWFVDTFIQVWIPFFNSDDSVVFSLLHTLENDDQAAARHTGDPTTSAYPGQHPGQTRRSAQRTRVYQNLEPELNFKQRFHIGL